MADKNAHYCTRMLHHHGFLTRTDVTAQFIGHDKKDDIGRADMFAARGGKAVNVEVKRGISGFLMTEWRENQRKWAEWSSQPPFCVPYYLYLTIGTHPPTYNPLNYLPRKSWLIPFKVVLQAEEKIVAYQKTLPMRVGKGMNKTMQELKLDAITLFEKYELKWEAQNALEKPEWMWRVDELESSGKTTAVVERSKKYGGFWIVPESHVFYREFIAEQGAYK